MHQMIPTYLLPIFGKDTFPAKNIPKSGLNRIPNLGHFPPPPNHTLYTSLVMSLTYLHGWDAEGQSPNLTLPICLASLFSDFVFFLLSAFSAASFVLFLHAFFVAVTLSHFFFTCCPPLWLCLFFFSFFMRFLLCLLFSLVWLFFPSRSSCC